MVKEIGVINMVIETFCDKCGGCVVLEHDNCGDIMLCLNCGHEEFIAIRLDPPSLATRDTYRLTLDNYHRRKLENGGYSSWKPQGLIV